MVLDFFTATDSRETACPLRIDTIYRGVFKPMLFLALKGRSASFSVNILAIAEVYCCAIMQSSKK